MRKELPCRARSMREGSKRVRTKTSEEDLLLHREENGNGDGDTKHENQKRLAERTYFDCSKDLTFLHPLSAGNIQQEDGVQLDRGLFSAAARPFGRAIFNAVVHSVLHKRLVCEEKERQYISEEKVESHGR